jgi:aminoglycoside phosphotransferase (APT) family kinase protein
MSEEIRNKLASYLSDTYPGESKIEIKDLASHSQGWESIIYSFDLVPGHFSSSPLDEMILRIYPGEDAREKSIREFEGLQRLLATGYPVPRVYILERDNSPFGKPFLLMERIGGEMLWSLIDRSTPRQVEALLTRFCELLVHLHSLDWRDFVPANEHKAYEGEYSCADRFLSWMDAIRNSFPDLNAFTPIFDWLNTHRDEARCSRLAPVHWDFHPGNLIIQPDESLVVIDWTQIQVTDLRFDLGWTLLLTGAHIGDDARNFILGEYQRLSETQVENLAFFDVANAVKRLWSVMLSLRSGAEQIGMRPDAVAAMRRDFPALRWVYKLMVERTGIDLPEVEQIFEM